MDGTFQVMFIVIAFIGALVSIKTGRVKLCILGMEFNSDTSIALIFPSKSVVLHLFVYNVKIITKVVSL